MGELMNAGFTGATALLAYDWGRERHEELLREAAQHRLLREAKQAQLTQRMLARRAERMARRAAATGVTSVGESAAWPRVAGPLGVVRGLIAALVTGLHGRPTAGLRRGVI
jgi:hypothetical protein